MEYTKITKIEVMLPDSAELYKVGENGVRKIMDDGDGFSVIMENQQVVFFNNAVPLRIEWKWRSE